MNTPPQPTQLAPGLRLVIGGILFISAAIFMLAMHRPHRAELPEIKETTDGWWLHQTPPIARLTPQAISSAAPRPVLVVQQPPNVTPPTPKPVSELWLRYRRAIETGMGGDTASVRQLPQVLPNGQPAFSPTPNIFAYGAYPKP